MRGFFIIVLMFSFFADREIQAKKPISPDDKIISFTLPEDVNTAGLRIEYFLSGAFGGFGSFIKISPENSKYEIPLEHDGKLVKELSLIIYGPHYETQTFYFQTFSKRPETVELKFVPLGTIPFSGRAPLPDNLNPEGLQVKIDYTPFWRCEFFGLLDCLSGYHPIASANLDKDGNFTVDLPDYARDPAIAKFNDKGEFSFRV